MRIIQITDSHISIDTPQRTADLERCIQSVNSVQPAADLVIHTGDVVHAGLREEYETAKRLLDTLVAPYIVLAGNKDDRQQLSAVFPDNSTLQKNTNPKKTDQKKTDQKNTDQKNINNNSAGAQEQTDFIQFSLEQFAFRLIVLDTVGQSNKGEFCEKRLQHLDAMLCADVGRPAVVFMHHAPVEIGEIPDPFQFDDWSQVDALGATFSKYENIQAIYCGHIHRNIASQFGRLPVSVLTCTACDLRKGQLSDDDKQRPMISIIDLPAL